MPPRPFRVRRATLVDAAEIAAIYNEGIDEGGATLNTEHASAKERRGRIKRGGYRHPFFVVTDRSSNRVVGWASISEYSPRACYAGIGEVSVYVRKGYRQRGLGRALLQTLIAESRPLGYWKLMGRMFVSNAASRRAFTALGFREVGVLEKHGKLGRDWIDVVEVERLIAENVV